MDKQESKMIAGVAIILMILLHVAGGNAFDTKSLLFDNDTITRVARFGKICVSLYAFVSGYGLWIRYKLGYAHEDSRAIKRIFKIYIEILKRLFRFYIVYWPFVILGALLTTIFEQRFNAAELIKNAVGLSWSYNAAWWYARYYVVMLLFIYPVSILTYELLLKRLPRVYRAGLVIALMTAMTIGCFVVGKQVTGALCLAVFLSGEVCAEWDVLNYIQSRKNLTLILFVIGLTVRCTYTNELGTLMLDLICVPMMIPAILKVCKTITSIGSLLYTVGVHSTSMWLLHTFLYKYSDWLNRFIPDAIIGWVVIIALAWAIAAVWDGVYGKITRKYLKM